MLIALTGMVAIGLAGGAAQAATVFSDDFESPDVASYSQGTTPTGWVRANQGYRSNYHGITDKAGGDFSAPDPNHQAYAFRYTNSGFTTAEGVIGALTFGSTYTVSFDVVRDDGGNAGTPYTAQLIAFGAGAVRDDCRSTPAGSVVVDSASGNAPGDGSFQTIGFDFTPDASHTPILGYDVGIRFKGATTSAIIDNVVMDVETPVVVDNDPPTPDPMTWAVVPTAVDFETVTMTATTASDPSGVEYLFTNTTTANNSGWQYTTEWCETGLAANTPYTYEVVARDLSTNQNATASSAALSATTLAPIPGLLFKESFEDPQVTGLTNAKPTGWSSAGHPSYTGLNNEDSGTFTTPHCAQAAKIYSTATLTTTPSILDAVLEPDMKYTLGFNVAERSDTANYDTRYAVDLLAGTTVLGTIEGEVTSSDMSEWYSIEVITDATHPNLGEALAIRLRKGDGGDWQSNPQYDNVTLTAVPAGEIPEPATLALLGLAAFGLGGYVRKRRRA